MSHFNITNFLSELRQQDIQIQVEGEHLKLNAPKGAVTAELRERLHQYKTDIIRFYQQQSGHKSAIPRLSRKQALPCSFAQQRLWLLDRLEPDSNAYNIPIFWWAMGVLNIPVFCQSVNEIIRRHESLRTVFHEPPNNGATPQQSILPELNLNISVIDLSALPAQEAETRIHEQATQAASTPFDLEQGPLLRLKILKVNAQQHTLLFTFHHSIFDGLSLAIFLEELGSLYQAFTQQQPSPLPELQVQYSDFSAWQRQRLSGAYLQEHLNFWRKELLGAPPVIGLPTDHPRPALQSYAGARLSFEVGAGNTQKLRQLAQQNGATLFMTFHAVLTILLTRYTSKNDIVIGTPIANRNHRQLESLIGFFANTIVLRTLVNPEDSFKGLLARIKTHTLETYKHQELPFEKLVDELNIERSTSHSPLFQVMLSFQNAHTEGFTLPDVDILPLEFDHAVSKFDLSFIVREHREKFTVILEYSTALFEAATIGRMIGHFQVLLDAIVSQPDLPISQLSMLTQQDVQQLQAWNDTAAAYPLEKTLVDLFEAQVEQTPDNVALVFHDQRFTYRQLNQQANQLAHYLLQNTVCKSRYNPLVAICVERSPNMLIGLLGILKAGAAYVPIDPGYPQDRIRHMLTDSKATVILTQSSFRDHLLLEKTGTLSQVLCLDETIFAGYPRDNLPKHNQPSDLAYVIYTSGSTGKPKGVMIQQKNLSNFLQDMKERTGITVNDRLLAVTTLSFDISALELYLPLISGSCLYLADKACSSDARALQQQLEQHQISFMQATPATWQLLRYSGWQARFPLNILCGGEALPPDLANYLLNNSHQLWNVYGPTETTIWSAASLIQDKQDSPPNIGKPIANTRIYILDSQHTIQPIGLPGELCIAGDGLARGYLNRPELTNEKFIKATLSGKQERIYKTGDLARWLPDGHLECLGRIDHQVKIRGFRIELGEIETLLLGNSLIREAAVIARSTTSGEQQLVAYVVVRDGLDKQAVVDQLKPDLQTKLPDYMIPAFFVLLDQLPLLPNGKINRKTLPEPDRFNASGKAYMHPRNSLELQLVQLWEETLNTSPISVFDNFFEVGGDSLLAIRLISIINRNFNVLIPLNTLFQHGSIEKLALLLRRDNHAHYSPSPLVTLQTRGSKPPIFCVHAAGGIVFRYLQLAKLMSTKYGHPFHGLQAKGIEPGEVPYSSIEEMAQHYVQAILHVKPEGPYLLAGWSMGGTVAFEMARIMESMGETVSGLVMIDAPSPYMDAYEADDVDFLLERLEPAAGISIKDKIEQQGSELAKKQLILEQKKQLGLFPPDIKLEEAEQRLAVHKHHNRLLCHYQPGSAISAGIAFIKATEETSFDEKMKDPLTAWAEFSHKSIIEHESPGNHFNMFSNEHSPVLAEKLHECLRALGI